MCHRLRVQVGGGPGGGTATGRGSGLTLAHLLLLDAQPRVRQAAAATLATLLEGPAQRAFLAVAEAREAERPHARRVYMLGTWHSPGL